MRRREFARRSGGRAGGSVDGALVGAARRAARSGRPVERTERAARDGAGRDRRGPGSERQRGGAARPASHFGSRDRQRARAQRECRAARHGSRRRRIAGDRRATGARGLGARRRRRADVRRLARVSAGRRTDRRDHDRRGGRGHVVAPPRARARRELGEGGAHRPGGRVQPRRRMAAQRRAGAPQADAVGKRGCGRVGDRAHGELRVGERRRRPRPAERSALRPRARDRHRRAGVQRRRPGRGLATEQRRDGARRVSRAPRLPRLLPAARRDGDRDALRHRQRPPHRARTARSTGIRVCSTIRSRCSTTRRTGARIPRSTRACSTSERCR